MKKSELLKVELQELRAEDDKRCKDMVYYEGHKQEAHDLDWRYYYDNFGRPARQRMKELEDEIRKEQNREIEVGDGVTICLYTDRNAATVIKRTKTTMTVQRDIATLNPDFKPEWVVGGFAGHCTNQDKQTYTYEQDTDGTTTKYYWSERYGYWQNKGSKLIIGRHEYYDYNF